MKSRIVLATSLAPRIERSLSNGDKIGPLYQHLCLRSWRESGFDIISVNAETEAEEVRAQYPEVEIVVAREDARAICGRPLVPVTEMMRAVRDTGARFGGIVNADVFSGAPDLADRLPIDGDPALIFASRTEVGHPYDTAGHVYRFGFDAFFFNVAQASEIAMDPFTIGLPWWDYALPTAFLLAGLPSVRAINFPMGHISHGSGWNYAQWTDFFNIFHRRFSPGYEALAQTDQAADLPALLGLKTIERIIDLYDDYEARHDVPRDDASVSHRHRMAYSVAAVDLVNEMAATWDYSADVMRDAACR